MDVTRQDLEEAGCWFDSDRGGSPQMTAFKREARWRQHHWAVDELSIPTFGTHPGRRVHPDVEPDDVHNGTKLLKLDADAGSNFLTPAIHALAQARVGKGQAYETLDAARLYRDLLSSMPMAFNLFGEAALPGGEGARDRLAGLFGVTPQPHSDIEFEWSPARRSERYTRDRTAFDVALRLGDDASPRTVVGIETKYHEHCTKEKAPGATKPEARARYQEQTDFLVAVAERSGVFVRGWQDHVLDTDLRQLWRDHLLALSMRAHPQLWDPQTRYVLAYPARNVSFAAAAKAYGELLVDGDASFRAVTLEYVATAAFPPGSSTGDAFARRYLW